MGRKIGSEDQAGRRHIHKGSHDQKEDIDDKEDHIPVIALLIPSIASDTAVGMPVNAITQLMMLGHANQENVMIPVILGAVQKNLRQFGNLD